MTLSKSDIQKLKNQVYEYTENGMFALSFAALAKLIESDRQWWAESAFEDLKTRCVQMLKFNLSGAPDPERSSFISALQSDIYSFTDDLVDDIAFRQFPGYENEQKRIFAASVNIDKDFTLNLCVQRGGAEAYPDEMMNSFFLIFKYVWLVGHRLKKEDMEFVDKILTDKSLETSFRAIIVSALMLRGIRLYDASVFALLIKHIDNENPIIKARVIVALIMLLSVHGNRLKYDKKTESLIAPIFQEDSLLSDFLLACRQIIKTFGTDAVTRKITGEIYPEVMKSGSKIRKMFRDNGEERQDDEITPEWIDALENSEAADKLREFSDMQMKGDDVYMSTFAGMKGFDFFKETANWFFPFDMRHKAILTANREHNDILSLFADMAPMCNSDKYSFVCVLNTMPESAVKTVTDNLKGDIDQIKEGMDAEKWKTKSRNNLVSTEMRFYVLDLFRFYRLHPRRSGFINPFDSVADVSENTVMMRILPIDAIKNLCEYLFEVKLWEKSVPLFNYLDNEGVWNSGFYQKMGFCFQQNGMWSEALNGYEKATLLDADDKWSLKRKALCYKKLGDNRSAIECYEQLLNANDKDVPVISSLANCYLETEEYDKAVSLYFKAYYLKPDVIKIKRGLVWSLFLSGDSNKALSVYGIDNDDNAAIEDLLNKGHIYLALHKFDDARKYYTKCRRKMDDDIKFSETIMGDMEYLCKYGITEEDISVIINQVIMLSEN